MPTMMTPRACRSLPRIRTGRGAGFVRRTRVGCAAGFFGEGRGESSGLGESLASVMMLRWVLSWTLARLHCSRRERTVGKGPVQGANDPRVPVNESCQIVERVGSNGLDIAYMEGANEGHGFRHPWNSFYAGLAQQEMMRECLMEG